MQSFKKYAKSHISDKELIKIINTILSSCSEVSNKLQHGPLIGIFGMEGKKNFSGDDVKKLDVIANNLLLNNIKHLENVYSIVSEELGEPYIVNPNGEYNIYIDPLDGSTNISSSISTGTIFGINKQGCNNLSKGSELIASGYVMYSSATVLGITWGDGTHLFTLDPETEEYILSNENIKIPDSGTYITINESRVNSFFDHTKKYINEIHNTTGFSTRFIGTFVADVHRILILGGVYIYPEMSDNLHGKIRLLYELNPLALIVEQAGGLAVSNRNRVLNIIPTEYHQKCPIMIGSPIEVDRYIKYLPT